jgi:hypothetical protein
LYLFSNFTKIYLLQQDILLVCIAVIFSSVGLNFEIAFIKLAREWLDSDSMHDKLSSTVFLTAVQKVFIAVLLG